jgi:hypothetical protein
VVRAKARAVRAKAGIVPAKADFPVGVCEANSNPPALPEGLVMPRHPWRGRFRL